MLVSGLLRVDLVSGDTNLGGASTARVSAASGAVDDGNVEVAGLRRCLGTDAAGSEMTGLCTLALQSQSRQGRDHASMSIGGGGRERGRSRSRLNVRVGFVGRVKHLVKGVLAINPVQARGLKRSSSRGDGEREGSAGAGVAEKDVGGHTGQGHAVLLVGSIGLTGIREAGDDGGNATRAGSLARS